jgi:phage terminase small subunit
MTLTTTKPPKAEPSWTDSAKAFWRNMHAEFVFEEPQFVELLRACCQQLSRADECRRAVDADGAIVADRFGQQRQHPGLGGERKAHVTFLRLARELGVDIELPESRGPRRPGSGG